MKTFLLLIVTVVFCMPSSSMAYDDNINYLVRGIGTDTCGQYIKANVTQKNWYLMWYTGYISGVNASLPGKYDHSNKIDIDSLDLWLENYCKNNPLETFERAVASLLKETSN